MPSQRYDVVVAGGGMAGVAAGIASARTGARALLLERYGFLGGMATAGMVGTVCGLYLLRRDGSIERLNDGLVGAIADAIERLPGSEAPLRRGRTVVVPYVPHELAALADDLTSGAAGLAVQLHAHLVDVVRSGNQVTGVRFATAEGVAEVECGALVDASGDAVAALAAGAAVDTPPAGERQISSLVFVFQNVDTEAVRGAAGVALLRRLAAAEADGTLPAGAGDLAWRPSARPGELVAKVALHGVAPGPDEPAATAVERAGRRRIRALADFLRRETPAFARAFVSHLAPQVGVRESRRIVGRHRLTRADVLGAERFPDAIARAAWPIELWRDDAAGARFEWLPDDAWYEIPLGCLTSADVPNLFAAGRCISGTSEALGSARVIGTCLATGAAAGAAAAQIAGAATTATAQTLDVPCRGDDDSAGRASPTRGGPDGDPPTDTGSGSRGERPA